MQDLDTVPRDQVLVRSVQLSDLDAMVSIDAASTGRRREQFLRKKLTQALGDTGIAMSLGAEFDGHLVGFLLARVYYGEFGVLEPSAVMDVFGVHPDYRGRHVASALLDQLRTNLLGLGIGTLQTEVRWDSPDLLSFFQHEGFTVAPRICLDLDLARTANLIASMTVTKSTRYALYAAAEMAMAGEGLVTVAAVAKRYAIPEGALAKVFQQLVRSGLAAGTRGIGGGYRLARPASKITVLEVLHVFERPRTAGACLLHDGPGATCPQSSACGLHWLFNEVDELVRCTYESVTLQTLVRRARRTPALTPIQIRRTARTPR